MIPETWKPRGVGERALCVVGCYGAAWLLLLWWLDWAWAWLLPDAGLRMVVASGALGLHAWFLGLGAVAVWLEQALDRVTWWEE